MGARGLSLLARTSRDLRRTHRIDTLEILARVRSARIQLEYPAESLGRFGEPLDLRQSDAPVEIRIRVTRPQ